MTQEEMMADGTQYCCYCGGEKVRFQCCGENHFQTFAQMSTDEQDEFLDNEEKEQQPTAWVYPEGLEALQQWRPWTVYGANGEGRIPLYTAPQPQKPWVGLTPEDYDSMRPRVPHTVNDFSFADVAAIVEIKLKEKNG